MEHENKCTIENERITVAKNIAETGNTIQEALIIVDKLRVGLFADESMKCERPNPKCLSHDVEINLFGAESLLASLRELADRLI